MKNNNKIGLKIVLVSFYTLITCVVLIGITKIYTYLNTGADRSIMLHTKIYETIHYQPEINWTTTRNTGRSVNEVTLKTIEKDYLNGWYVKQLAFKNNNLKGIQNYFTKSVFENIKTNITHNKQAKININSTTIKHHPSIDFYSEDGQVVLITDHDIIEKKVIYQNKKLLLESTEINTYQYLLLLQDGFWRTRQILKIKPTKNPIHQQSNLSLGIDIKGINYYPKDTPWDMYGNRFNINIINEDFKLLNQQGLNTIRIFIPYKDFGASEVEKEKLKKLESVLNTAHKNHLKVIVTLFDFYGDYNIMDWTLNNKHISTIVKTIKNNPALLAWDIKNEPNLDFKTRGKNKVLAWLNQSIKYLKSIDQNHPITVGWSNIESAVYLNEQLDFISFHYYEDLNLLSTAYQKLKKTIPKKTIVLGEYGLSSYHGLWNLLGPNEKEQANYHKQFQEIAKKDSIPFISWTLYDFKKVPKEVVGKLPWRQYHQKHFGFINVNGKPKKSFKYIVKP